MLIRTRAAADAVGATRMDRPEWIAVHPATREVYCTLTNNSRRGTPQVPGLNAANPRPNNVFGHIIRWREDGSDPAALKFKWDIFVMAGTPNTPMAASAATSKRRLRQRTGCGLTTAGCWDSDDVSTSVLNKGDYANLGNNQMLCAPTSRPASGVS